MNCYRCGKEAIRRAHDVMLCFDCAQIEDPQTYADPAYSLPEVTMESIHAAIEEIKRLDPLRDDPLLRQLRDAIWSPMPIPMLLPPSFDGPDPVEHNFVAPLRWYPSLRAVAQYPRFILPEIPKIQPPRIRPVVEAVDPVAYRMCPKGGGEEGYDWAPEYQACEVCCARDPAEWTVAVSLITVRGEEVPVCVECSLAAWALSLPGDQMKTRLFYPECLTESRSDQ